MARTVIPTADLKKKGGLRYLDGSRSMAGTILQQQRERERKREIIIKIYH